MVLEPQTGIPLHPVDTPPAAPRRDGAADGALRYQRCIRCGTANFAPTELCRGCASRSLEWRASTGLGTVQSWTEVHRPTARDATAPYTVAIVDLDEGYRMLTNLIGIESHAVREGMRVRIDPHGAGGERVLPYFRPQFPPPAPPAGDAPGRPAPEGGPRG